MNKRKDYSFTLIAKHPAEKIKNMEHKIKK